MLQIVKNIADFGIRLKEAVLYVSSPSRATKQRSYDAGRITRFSSDWIPTSQSINRDIRQAGRRVRDRARDLRKNNPYANGYRYSNRANIVGPEGFRLQAQVKLNNGEYDDVRNSEIEEAFEEWCSPDYCTMSGRYHFIMVQWMVSEQMKFDGEFLVRKIENLNPKDNRFGFALELLDPDDLDETYNEDLGNGEVVVMGVQIDEWRRIKKFHFRNRQVREEIYGAYSTIGKERISIDASEVIYGFDPEHYKQVRGMTKLSAIMISLKGIDRWEDASLTNSTLAAQKMGFLEETAPDAEAYTGSSIKGSGTPGAEKDPYGGKYADFEAGIIEKLPYGNKFTAYDPKFPTEQHTPFLKAMLRKVAIGLGLSYNGFANDLEGVNFSSMRSGLLIERDNWMCEQTMFRLLFLEPLFDAWLRCALKAKAINRSYSEYQMLKKHKWQPRRWPWVDPEADVNANIKAARAGLKPESYTIAEMGGDIEDVYREYARLQKLREKYGLSFDLNASNSAANPNGDKKNKSDSSSEDNRNIIKIAG